MAPQDTCTRLSVKAAGWRAFSDRAQYSHHKQESASQITSTPCPPFNGGWKHRCILHFLFFKVLPTLWSYYSIFGEKSNVPFGPPEKNQNQNKHHPQHENWRNPCPPQTCGSWPTAHLFFPLTFDFHIRLRLSTCPLTQYGKGNKGNV